MSFSSSPLLYTHTAVSKRLVEARTATAGAAAAACWIVVTLLLLLESVPSSPPFLCKQPPLCLTACLQCAQVVAAEAASSNSHKAISWSSLAPSCSSQALESASHSKQVGLPYRQVGFVAPRLYPDALTKQLKCYTSTLGGLERQTNITLNTHQRSMREVEELLL